MQPAAIDGTLDVCVCTLGTHCYWMDRGSVEYKVCPTLLHMTSAENRTPDLLILSPTACPLCHVYQNILLRDVMAHIDRVSHGSSQSVLSDWVFHVPLFGQIYNQKAEYSRSKPVSYVTKLSIYD